MDYGVYVQKAYRQMVHDILAVVAKEGVENGSAYYITFQTNRDDVILPDFVRARYPQEITVVLENQFEELTVTDTGFSVQLSFGGVSSFVQVPFTAVMQFADTPRQFGLVLQPVMPQPAKEEAAKEMPVAQIVSMDELRAAKKVSDHPNIS